MVGLVVVEEDDGGRSADPHDIWTVSRARLKIFCVIEALPEKLLPMNMSSRSLSQRVTTSEAQRIPVAWKVTVA